MPRYRFIFSDLMFLSTSDKWRVINKEKQRISFMQQTGVFLFVPERLLCGRHVHYPPVFTHIVSTRVPAPCEELRVLSGVPGELVLKGVGGLLSES